jgi:hypothetical protein
VVEEETDARLLTVVNGLLVGGMEMDYGQSILEGRADEGAIGCDGLTDSKTILV